MYSDGDEIMACQTCHRILDFHGGTGKHIHTEAYANPDHEPVPTPAAAMVEALNLVCDFCGRHVEVKDVWTLPCATFVMYTKGGVTRNSIGDWLACPLCAGLINTGSWRELVTRALVTHGMGEFARRMFTALYGEVERHAKGAAEHRLSYEVKEQ